MQPEWECHTLKFSIVNQRVVRIMGMFDEFQFDEGFSQLPKNLAKDGWQSKDLECELSLFRILADGRILRKGCRLTNDEEVFYFSDLLSGHFGLYDECNELTLIVKNGFVINVTLGLSENSEADLNWQPFQIHKM